MKVLVTGASGGLGRLVIPRLLELGHSVIATSKNSEKAKDLPFFQQVVYVPYDIYERSEKKLFYHFHQPDILIHLAWDKLNDYRNEEHTKQILESHKSFVSNLIKHGLKDITGIGTCYEYGLIEGEMREDMSSIPVLPYPQGKNELRKYIEDVVAKNHVSFKWLRVFYVFGEIVGRKNLYTMLNQTIAEKRSVFDMSGGGQIRDFLSPKEIAEIIVKVALQKNVSGIINCCSGKPVKLKDFVADYLNKQNSSMKLNLGVYPYADYEPMNSWGSEEKLNKIC